jgi:histidinol-phosphatase
MNVSITRYGPVATGHVPTHPDLALALRLADAVDAVTLPRFRAADLRIERKADRTPVTDADTAAEDMLRTLLAHERPDDGVFGEERGGQIADSGRTWVLDPIDGTKNFSRGLPMWASLIGLCVDGRPVVGVVSAPAFGRRWWAATGQGAWLSEAGGPSRRLAVSGVGELAEAYVSTTDVRHWQLLNDRRRWLRLADASWESRSFGDFWMHMLVAEGCVDVAAEVNVKPWDLAALAPIVVEAGGRFTDFAGTDTISGGSALSTNGLLHDAALVHVRPWTRVNARAGLIHAYTQNEAQGAS